VNSARAKHAPPPWPSQAAARPRDIIRLAVDAPTGLQALVCVVTIRSVTMNSLCQAVTSGARTTKKKSVSNQQQCHAFIAMCFVHCGGRGTLRGAPVFLGCWNPFMLMHLSDSDSIENSDLCVSVRLWFLWCGVASLECVQSSNTRTQVSRCRESSNTRPLTSSLHGGWCAVGATPIACTRRRCLSCAKCVAKKVDRSFRLSARFKMACLPSTCVVVRPGSKDRVASCRSVCHNRKHLYAS
jgi:hypothetical protein